MHNLKQKLSDLLKKLNTPLTLSVIFAVVGLLFIFLPLAVLEIFFIILGAIILILGSVELGLELKREKRGLHHTLGIVKSVLLMVLGGSMIFFRGGILVMLCRAVGGVMLGFGIFMIVKLARASGNRDTKWGLSLAGAITLTAIGGALLSYPIYPGIMLGIAFLVLAVKFVLDSRKNKGGGGSATDGEDGVYYTDDFVDKSDS